MTDEEIVRAWHLVAIRELGPVYNRATIIYEHHCEWCEARGFEPMALPTFGKLIRERIADAEKIEGRVYIRLRPTPAPSAA